MSVLSKATRYKITIQKAILSLCTKDEQGGTGIKNTLLAKVHTTLPFAKKEGERERQKNR